MRIFLPFLLSIISFLTLQAQDLNKAQALEIAQQLHNQEILSEKGKEQLLKALEENELSINKIKKQSVILEYLSDAFLAEFIHRDGVDDKIEVELEELFVEMVLQYQAQQVYDLVDTSGKTNLIHENKSVLGNATYNLLQDLLEWGLIDNKVYEDAALYLKKEYIVPEHDLIDFCLQRIWYYQQYPSNKRLQFLELEALHQANLLSQEDLATIKASYQPWELQQKFDWLPYCKNTLVFDLSQYPSNPLLAYPLYFEAIKTIVPNFDYKNLQIDLIEQSRPNSWVIRKVQVCFELGDQSYCSLRTYDYIKGDTPNTLTSIPTGIHTLINKVLIERKAPERVYFANKGKIGATHPASHFGLLLLNEQEYVAWGGAVDPFFLAPESHDNSFNKAHIKKTIQDFQQIGLFDHLTATEIAQAEKTIQSCSITDVVDILLCFPRTVLYFNWIPYNLTNPYEELTQELAVLSRGKFTPSHIVDEYEQSLEQDTSLFSFYFNNKYYSIPLKRQVIWLDDQFIKLIQQALEEQQIEEKLYECVNNGEAIGYLFLSLSQYQWIEKNYPDLLEKY